MWCHAGMSGELCKIKVDFNGTVPHILPKHHCITVSEPVWMFSMHCAARY